MTYFSYENIRGSANWEAMKTIMRYIKGTICVSLKFKITCKIDFPLVGFVDEEYASNVDTRKSITSF